MPEYRMAIVPVTVFQQNATILWEAETKRCVLVDPGGEVGRILDVVVQQELQVEAILLTHGHLDHAGGAEAARGTINEEYARRGWPKVEVIGPDERDRFLLEAIEGQAAQLGLSGLLNVVPDRFLAEGDVVEAIGLRFEVLHCPGHTPGHIVFFERGLKLALSGDVIFRGSVGRTDMPYGDHDGLIAAIRQKLLPLGDDVRFICGHGPGSTFGAERLDNPFLKG